MTREVLLPYAEEAHQFARKLSTDILPEYVSDDLCGACAIASAYLHKRLRAVGIESRITIGAQHVFVRVGDWYVDVTAEQFGHPPVYIGKQPPNDDPTYFDTFTTDDFDTLLTHMETHGWPWDAQMVNELVLTPRRAA